MAISSRPPKFPSRPRLTHQELEALREAAEFRSERYDEGETLPIPDFKSLQSALAKLSAPKPPNPPT